MCKSWSDDDVDRYEVHNDRKMAAVVRDLSKIAKSIMP
jgi:hypothetical protein